MVEIVSDAKRKNEVFSIAGPDPVSYRRMVSMIKKEMGVKRVLIPVPITLVKAGAYITSHLMKTAWTKEKIDKLCMNKNLEEGNILKSQFNINPTRFNAGIKQLVRQER